MKVIKEGNIKKQHICKYCGSILEYDLKVFHKSSKMICPLCEYEQQIDPILNIEKIMESMITERVENELSNVYNCINTYIKSRSFTNIESVVIDSILNIISQYINTNENSNI